MENQEEVLQSLEDFAKMKPKEIPKELEDYLEYVAKTGDPVYQWSAVKCLFREKLLKVITDFYESCPTCPNNEFTPCPNVEPFNYENMKASLLERLDSFASAPFTIQRLCELLTTPTKEYTRVDKFMRAVEKNILVVSTKEPGNRRSDVQSDFLMNGVMDGRALDIGEAIETVSSDGVNLLQTEENDVNVSNGLRIDELDMENRSDIENTSDAVWDKDQRESSDVEKQSAKTSEKNVKLEAESGSDSPKITTGQIGVKDEAGEPQQALSHVKDKTESDHSSATQEISNPVTAHEVVQKTDSTSILSTANVSETEQSPNETGSNSSQHVDSVHVEEVSHSEEREQELIASSTGIVLEADENVSQVSAGPEEEDDVLSNDSYSPTQPVESIIPSPPAVVISEIGTEVGEEVEDGGSATVVVTPAVAQEESVTPGATVEEVVIATSVTSSASDQAFRETAVVEELEAGPIGPQQEVVPPTETPAVEELENAMVSEVVDTVENVKVLTVEAMQPHPLQPSPLHQQQPPQQSAGCDESMEVDEQLQLQEEMSMDGDEPMDQTEEMTGVVTEVDS